MIRYLLSLSLFATFCAKKSIPVPPAEEPKSAKVKFMFVNRIGFRNDSTTHGRNDTIFQAACLDLKYYDKKPNMSYLVGTCYNRNAISSNYPLVDSILFREYPINLGSKYKYQIELVWKNSFTWASTRVTKYNLKSYPNTDTLKLERDTTIKFIWPDDTNSGKFVKTYQWP